MFENLYTHVRTCTIIYWLLASPVELLYATAAVTAEQQYH